MCIRDSITAERDRLVGEGADPEVLDLLAECLALIDEGQISLESEYYGQVILALEEAYAKLNAVAFVLNDTPAEMAFDMVTEGHLFYSEILTRYRFDYGGSSRMDRSEDELSLAQAHLDNFAPGDALLSIANGWFWMEEGRNPQNANNYLRSRSTLEAIRDEMQQYIDHPADLPGKTSLADAKADLDEVQVLIDRVVADGDTSLSDLEHVDLLLGLANTAEDLVSAQENTVWVRNWQWGLTQIVYLYADRGLTNAISVGGSSPVLDVGVQTLADASVYRTPEDPRPDDFMGDLIDSRCLIVSVYNFSYEPDYPMSPRLIGECCDIMEEFEMLDASFIVPDECD